MRGGLPRLTLRGGPDDRGRTHGSTRAEGIRRYAADRVALAASGTWAGRPATVDAVTALACRMLPHHRAYAPDLTDEMEALAEAAGISPAHAIILGGFTDFVDALRGGGGEDDCTSVLVPPSRGGPFLAQTWDMHASATDHVVLLDIEPTGGPCATVFTTEGCLGQIGMNAHGIAIGINNLTAADGRVGVTWPHVVRKALQQSTLDDALACVVEAPLAGGHAFLLLDAEGDGYLVEAMPTLASVKRLDADILVHSNHTLDDAATTRQAVKPPDLVASSHARLRHGLVALADGLIDRARLMAWTADPVLCRRPDEPHHLETSGAVVMATAARELWACWGPPDAATWERA